MLTFKPLKNYLDMVFSHLSPIYYNKLENVKEELEKLSMHKSNRYMIHCTYVLR